MNKLIKRPSYLGKLERFKKGGQIQKALIGTVLKKGAAYLFNGYDGDFKTAFRAARNKGQEYFRWNGKLYNTNIKSTPQPVTLSAPKLDTTHRFKTTNYDEFISVMYPIFEASFKKYNLPTTLILNVLRQAAFESTYGTDPRGSQGFNLGGIKWEDNPNSRTYNYKHTTFTDGNEYVDFDNLLDYADYKIYLLNDTYHALDAPNTNEFVNRLHGQNPSKKSYSASKNRYRTTLNNMKSFDRAYENYMANRK